MVTEANKQGLTFDEGLLSRYLASGSSAVRHNSMKPVFWVDDQVIRAKIVMHARDGKAFLGRRRRLGRPECVSVRIAESTAEHFRAGEDYQPVNMDVWAKACAMFADCVEPVIGLPEPSYDEITALLTKRGVSLSEVRAGEGVADSTSGAEAVS